MATLFNTKISQTYEGLLKTIDNAAISATLRELTDGSGNQSGLYLNTAGDFKVSAILEWGSLKDTGTGVTITRFVTSTDGLENFDNNTSLPTSAAVKLYVDTKFSQTDTLTEVLGFGNTTSGKDIAVSAGDDITLTTTSKIIMGTSGAAGNFQIYNDGSNSYISENGAGDLRISTNAAQVAIQNSLTENMARFIVNNAVILYYDNVNKFQTTTAGAQVTGDLVVTGTITGSGGSFLPLAGGTMTGNIVLNDNVKTSYGTSADFEIFHNASTNSNFIQSNLSRQLILAQDNIFIGNQAASESMITGIADAAVSLFYDNSKKFETTNTGAKVNGFIQVTNGVDVTGGNIDMLDNSKIRLGTSQDLQIYHDGSNSYIAESGTGLLNIFSNGTGINLLKDTGEFMAEFVTDGAVSLFYDNSKKFETLTDGAKVTGNLEVTGTITGAGGSFLPLIGGTMTGNTIHNDNVKSIYGTASDGLEIFHNGTDSYISDTGTGSLNIKSDGAFIDIQSNSTRINNAANSEIMATFVANGAVSLYYDNSNKLATTNTGISVTGNGAFSTGVSIPDAQYGKFGTSDDFIIGHDGSNTIMRNYTGNLYIDQAAVTQSIFFRVSDANALDVTALTISRNGDLTTGRDVTIAGDLTVNGTTTTVNSQTLAVVDPLIQLAKDNTANSLDIGLYGDYNDGTGRYLGLFSDASDGNKFKLFKGTTVEPTTTVNIGGAGYVAADLQVAGFEATTGTFGGNITTNGYLTLTGQATPQLFMTSNTAGTPNWTLIAGTNGYFTIGRSGVGNDFYFDPSGNATFSENVNVTGGITGTSANLTTSGTVLSLDRIGGANALIELKIGGTVEGYLGATSTKSLVVFNESASEKFSISNSGDGTFAGTGTFITNLTVARTSGSTNDIFKITSADVVTTLERLENTGDANAGYGRLAFKTNAAVNVAAGRGGFQFINGSGSDILYLDNNNSSATFAGNATFAGSVDWSGGAGRLVSNQLQSGYNQNADNADFWINYTGYQGGSTYFRDFRIGDGKQNQIAFFDGSTKNVTFAGNVGIGTDSPGSPLTIKSNSGISSDSGLTIQANASTNTIVKLGERSNGRARLEMFDFGVAKIAFYTDGNNNYINAGNVGIGTTSPSVLLDARLSGTTGKVAEFHNNSGYGIGFTVESDGGVNTINSESNQALAFATNGVSNERMRITSTGNVGIGTDSPQRKLVVSGAADGIIQSNDTAGAGSFLRMLADVTAENIINWDKDTDLRFSTSDEDFGNFTERMRITSGGDVLIGGITSVPSNGSGGSAFISDSVGRNILKLSTTTVTTVGLVEFDNPNGIVGKISSSNSSTIYATSSDYRLKEDLKDFAGLDMVSKIPVYDFKWKTDESRSYGVMAHELQEVLPDAVSGEKDAEEMQGVDYSKIVPLLVKSIQELTAKVEKLESQNCKCKI